MRTYINNIGEIALTSPITVEIEKDEDYVASIPMLSLFAYGDNLDDTINELKNDLVELYDDLFNGKYELANTAVKFKNYLEKLIN